MNSLRIFLILLESLLVSPLFCWLVPLLLSIIILVIIKTTMIILIIIIMNNNENVGIAQVNIVLCLGSSFDVLVFDAIDLLHEIEETIDHLFLLQRLQHVTTIRSLLHRSKRHVWMINKTYDNQNINQRNNNQQKPLKKTNDQFIHLFFHSFFHLIIHPFIIRSSIHPFIHLFIHSSIYSFIN